MNRPTLGTVIAIVLASATGRGQSAWIVDAAGEGDFTEIQPAVDAATGGDVVLVRPGDYAGFTIVGEGVSVFAERDGLVRCGQVAVLELGSGQDVVLAGLDTLNSAADGVVLEDCAGNVRLQHCYLRGAPEVAGSVAARITACAGVTIVDSTCRGGLSAVGSTVAIHGAGGFGGIAAAVLDTTTLEASFLFVSSAELRGMDGETNHTVPGDGTDALVALDGSEVQSIASAFTRGLAGDCFGGAICISADDGEDLIVDGTSTVNVLPASGRRMSTRQSIGSECLALTFTGVPDDGVFLVGSRRLGFEFSAERAGVRSIEAPVGHVFQGTRDGGTVSPFPLDLAPPFQGRLPASGVRRVALGVQGGGVELVHLQSVFVTDAGERYWGSPLSLAMLPVDPVDCDADGVPDACAIASDPRLDADDNGFLDSCQGRLYVDRTVTRSGLGLSWSGAFKELRGALSFAAAHPGVAQEIWVAEGSYRPALAGASSRASFELVDGVAIRGGFAGTERDAAERDLGAHETILTGDLAGDDGAGELDDNAEHVVTIHEDVAAELDGVTVAHGNTQTIHSGGAGVLVWAPTGPGPERVFRDCRFADNRALVPPEFMWGGGVRLYGKAVFERCVFENNQSFLGGGIDARYSGPEGVLFEDCLFRGNFAAHTGGACYFAYLYPPRLKRCVFEGNAAASNGGAFAVTTCDTLCVSSTFTGNTAGNEGGAVDHWRGDADFVNCLFVGNASTNSGAAIFFDIDVSTERLTLVGCTLVSNATQDQPGAVRVIANSTIDVHDSILWKNTYNGSSNQTAQLMLSFGAIADVTYSCLQNLGATLPGHDNIDLNPRFIDLLGPDGLAGTGDEDLRLAADSPCIDAADNTRLPLDELDVDDDGDLVEQLPFDLDGLRRRQDDPAVPDTGNGTAPVVDMGAYERQ